MDITENGSTSVTGTTNDGSSDSYWSSHPNPALLHRSLHEPPIVAESTFGNYIQLQNGVSVLDACGGAAVAIIGHGNQEVISAICKQLSIVSYVHSLTYTTSAAEELAEVLVSDKPGGLSKAFFVSSGSEAIDGAMKLARQYFFEKGETERKHFISRRKSYHGNTWGAMSLSNNLSRLVPYKDILLPHVSHLTPCYPYQYKEQGESDEKFVRRLAAELDVEFKRLGPGNVIAFVAETVGGATSGCITPLPGYFSAMRDVCKRHGALLILDEIMCGVGRTGTFFDWEQEGISPDIMTLGKGLGGGYSPIAGILIHEDVVSTLAKGSGKFNHGHTYQAHPLSCAAALAVQKIVKRDNLVERCKSLGLILETKLNHALGSELHVGEIRGRGLLWAIEFVKDRATKEPFDPKHQFGLKVQFAAFNLGIAIYPGAATVNGLHGDHVLIAPPYTISEIEIDVIVQAVAKAYHQALEELEC